MLDFNLKAKNITRKLLNAHKASECRAIAGWTWRADSCLQRDKQLKASQHHFETLPDRPATAAFLSLKDLLSKENELKAREDALEQEKLCFQAERTAWTTNMTAQKKKQTLIRRGATIMFRTHRLETQQEREEQEKSMHALENGLLQMAQQELDLIDQEHAEVIGNLLAATAAQVSCAAVSLSANARATAISDRLTNALDTVHQERLHVMDLTEEVNMKSAELDVLMSQTEAERIKAQESFTIAQSYVSRFSLAAETISLVQEQIESNAIEDRERLSKAIDKERNDALEEARNEARKRLAALRDARTAFEKLREAEKANLAKGYARVEHSRAVVDMEKELVKKEMVRARLLAIKAEQERAASVDAKKAALEELQAARIMRDESRRALHKLVAIADEMAIPTATSDKSIKNVTSSAAGVDGNAKTELSQGMLSRFGFYVRDRRASSQGQINGATSSVNEIEGGGFQKRCESLNIIKGEDGLQSPVPSVFSRPRLQRYGKARNNTETSVDSPETSLTTDPVDVTAPTSQNYAPAGNVRANTKDFRPTGNGHVVSHFLEPSVDKQPSRMKLGSIGNTVYQVRGNADQDQIGAPFTNT